MTEPKPDIATMPFEAALAELEAIVDQLEKGAVALDESIRLYERGEALEAALRRTAQERRNADREDHPFGRRRNKRSRPARRRLSAPSVKI